MNIFRRFYNWFFGIKPEQPLTPRRKMRLAMQRCINAIRKQVTPKQRGYSQSACLSERGCPCHPPITQTELHERLDTNWKKRMDSQEKKMSRGAQNIFRIIKGGFNWGNKNLWRRCDKQKPSTIKYGKPHRGHNN